MKTYVYSNKKADATIYIVAKDLIALKKLQKQILCNPDDWKIVGHYKTG